MGATANEKWRRMRNKVWASAGYRCHYCNDATPPSAQTLDHIIPAAFGGPRSLWNVVPACEVCNNRLGNAVNKCDCLPCRRAVARFHKARKRANAEPVMWVRKHGSDDEVLRKLIYHMQQCQRFLLDVDDDQSAEAVAARGKIRGLNMAIEIIGRVQADVTMESA